MSTQKKPRTRKTKVAYDVHYFDFVGDIATDVAEVQSETNVPSKIQLLPPSGFSGRDGRGPYVYTFEELQAAFIANKQELPIDLDHQILRAKEGLNGRAYGWIKAIEQDVNGVVWGLVEWTQEGHWLVESKAYRYISPTYRIPETKQKEGEPVPVLGLVGAALVNLPNLKMTALNSQEIGTEGDDSGADETESVSDETTAEQVELGSETNATEAPATSEESADEVESTETADPAKETSEPTPVASETTVEQPAEAVVESAPPAKSDEHSSGATDEIAELRAIVAELNAKVAALESATSVQTEVPANLQDAVASEGDTDTSTHAQEAEQAPVEPAQIVIETMATEVEQFKTELMSTRTLIESMTAELATVTEAHAAVVAEMSALRSEIADEKATAAVDAAIAACHFAPAQREHLVAMARNDLNQFKSFTANTASLKSLLCNSLAIQQRESADSNFGLTADELAEAKRLGIDPELYAARINKQ
jgi:hypothetical protein